MIYEHNRKESDNLTGINIINNWEFHCVISGTDEERGLVKWNAQFKSADDDRSEVSTDTYGLPFGMGIIKR